MVGTCHNFRDEAKVQTSLLAVSEDGALRGWILNGDKEEETHQWRNLMVENNQMKRAKVQNTLEYSFPINFFESCEHIQEVEFSSPQLARIYNKNQLKQRLAPSQSSQSQYVAWRGGFSIQVKAARNRIIRGVRVHVGQNGPEVVPPHVTFGSRQFPFVDINRAKWVDIVFTAKESLEFNGKVNLTFAPSNHQDQRVIIEAIKVFGQSRRLIEAEAANESNSFLANQSQVIRNGPNTSDDIFDSKVIECYALCSNLITKPAKVCFRLEVSFCLLLVRFNSDLILKPIENQQSAPKVLKRLGNILTMSMLILKVFKVVLLCCHLVSDFLRNAICLLLIALIWILILIGVHFRQSFKKFSPLECIGRQHLESICQVLNVSISISALLQNLKDFSGSSYFLIKTFY